MAQCTASDILLVVHIIGMYIGCSLMDTSEDADEYQGAMTSVKCFDHLIDHQFLKKGSASWA